MSNRLTKNIFYLGIVQVANYILPIAFVPIISRIIGPEKYGSIDFAAAFVAYFGLLVNYGFDFSATRKIRQSIDDSENNSRVFSHVFSTQLLLLIFASIVFTILMLSMEQFRMDPKVAVFSFLICIASLFTQNWFFQAMQDLKIVAILNFVAKLLFVVTVILVIKSKDDYFWQPLIASTVQILIGLVSFFIVLKKYKIDLRLVPIKECFKLLKEESTVFFSIMIVNLYTTTNIVLLGFFQNTSAVAYYSAGQKLIVIVQSILVMPLMQALYPYIGNYLRDDFKLAVKTAQKIFPLIFILLSTCGLGMLVLSPIIIQIFFGKAFTDSVIAFQIMVFVPLLVAVNYFQGIIIMLNMKMDKLYFKITVYAAILSLLLNILFVPRYSYIGSALIWVVVELFIAVVMYFKLRGKGIDVINFSYWNFGATKDFLQPFLITKLDKKKASDS
ncbi:flippase [Pedobacter sandarakinus]|uniref:flippase n=1 Tax=Pedobacter sandarakinus TaxID=353156 RepID=UPI002246FD5A|nr:flippase [Pedobacter sandarakinus]MCX2574015.1 flippase [Pedobacter sandarakinus]